MAIQFVFKEFNDPCTVFSLGFSFFRVVTQNVTVASFTITDSHLLGVEIVFEGRVSASFGQDILLDFGYEGIEKKLYKRRFSKAAPTLFLYDVTSSYLEGVCNELTDWGYSRDKKKGKIE